MDAKKRLFVVLGLALAALALFLVYRASQRAPLLAAPATSAAAGSARSKIGLGSSPGAAGRSPRPLRLPSATAELAEDAARGSFEGRVLSWTTGAGVPHAELTFAHDGVTSRVLSGDDGAFRFTPPEEGPYELALASASGYLPFAPLFGQSPIAFTARKGERIRGATIYLIPAVPYVAVVLGPDKAPVKGAEVRVIEDGGGDGSPSAAGERSVTDERGEARFTAPDDAVVEARHPSFSPGRASLDLSAQVSHRLVIRLGPKRSGEAARGVIAGKVVDQKGAPVEGALVQAIIPDAPRTAGALANIPHQARSDEQGRFSVEELEDGAYQVTALIPNLAPAHADGVPVGTMDLTLTLSKGGALRGKVTDRTTGKPIPAFAIFVSTRLGPLESRSFTERTVFDAQGAYAIEGLAPGSYGVTVIAEHYAESRATVVTLADPPGEPSVADFALDRGGRITGVVLDDATHKPLAGARVSLEGRSGGGSSGVPLFAAITSDSGGRFELTGLSAGLQSISVAADGHHSRIISGLAATESGDIGPITIELTKTRDGEEPKVELTGIGAVLSAKGDALVLGSTLPGGGAAVAGLTEGDAIVAIDGVAVTEIGFQDSIQRIRGPEGSSVKLVIRREGDKLVEIVVSRRRIRPQ